MTQTLGRVICTESQHFYNFQCLIQNFRVSFFPSVFPSPTSMGIKHKYMARAFGRTPPPTPRYSVRILRASTLISISMNYY